MQEYEANEQTIQEEWAWELGWENGYAQRPDDSWKGHIDADDHELINKYKQGYKAGTEQPF